jgi:N-methylhydantoinase A/oxoprolinase/acetone carboxylase beta subunit
VRAKPELPRIEPAPSPDPASAQVGETALRAAGAWLTAPVYERSRLRCGHHLIGPALVVQEDATTVLLPGWQAQVDPWGHLVITR